MSSKAAAVGALSTLRCRGCGHVVEISEPYPFRCPRAGEGDVDHVLRRVLAEDLVEDAAGIFARLDPRPFVRFRELFHAYQAARAADLSDEAWIGIVERLDAAVASVDGSGFRETPCSPNAGLAGRLGVAQVWVKDESGNVSGSHKGRHLMGVMLWLEAAAQADLVSGEPLPLGIASCGNAALAAAVVARAARRRLEVFVPPHANRNVLDQLAALEAHLHSCERRQGEAGDPCYLRFREAVFDGTLPFTCQGNENGLTIDGGKTLAWELVAALRSADAEVDRIFLHVGGGALATAVIEGLRDARDLGLLRRMPVVHAVQTTGAYPLVRAWRLLAERTLERWAADSGASVPASAPARAELLASPGLAAQVRRGLQYAVSHRSEFMWPWEEEPHSIADGILDDETYDWVAVVEGMLETGGWPIVVAEETLIGANALARETMGVEPCHTGTAGLAGAMTLAEEGFFRSEERVALIVSGINRG